MTKKRRNISLVIFIGLIALTIVGIVLTSGFAAKKEPVQTVMRDAVLHEGAKISLFGFRNVNPGLVSAFSVTAIISLFALTVRIFVIPKFKRVPGRFQLLLEQAVGLFDNLAKTNSPHRNGFLGSYVFATGAYVFIGTIFELFGFQALTVTGESVSLPAPLSDINGAICRGCL